MAEETMGAEEGHPIYSNTADDARLIYMSRLVNPVSRQGFDVRGLRAQDRVLDIGAGPVAELGQFIAETGAQYVALDKNSLALPSQLRAGNFAIAGAAEALPLADDSVDIVHARFSMSWLRPEGRAQAWREMLRVGTRNLDVLDIEYDWSVASGHPAYEKLLGMMQRALRLPALGFEPFYGAYARADIQNIAADILRGEGFVVATLDRRQLSSESAEKKKVAIRLTADGISAGLKQMGRLEQAADLDRQADEVMQTDISSDDMRLPDVVTVLFSRSSERRMQPATKAQEIVSLALGTYDTSDVPIWRLSPPWDEHPLGRKGMDFFTHMYERARYLVRMGLSPEVFREATDPAEVRARSDMFLGLNPSGDVRTHVRMVRPTDDGLLSLPTANKFIEKYGREKLPPAMQDGATGEIGYFVSSDRMSMVRSILAATRLARQAGIRHIVYGAVAGEVSRHFNTMFGPGLRPVQVGGDFATVVAKGKGRVEGGTPLAVGYFDTDSFVAEVADYHRTSGNPLAARIISLCSRLV